MYPALFPFIRAESWLSYLKQLNVDSADEVENARLLLGRNLIPLLHGCDLGHYLGISPRLVGHMAKAPKKYYQTFSILKRNGTRRQISAPRVFLKTLQRYLLDCVLDQIPLHEAAVGFRPKMNCATGARRHVGNRFLWNIDLEDFFPSIRLLQVERVFADVGYKPEVAGFLAQICCLDSRLPQGAPTSPAIANILFTPVDEKLDALSKEAELMYSRYADDLSFSGNKLIPAEFRKKVLTLIKAHGFRVNHSKSRLIGPGARREVTGLTVNASVSIPRKRRRKLRAFFHQVSKNPLAFSDQKAQAIGYAAWAFDYHEAEGKAYLEIAHKIPDQPKAV
jgi:retron-type reverse transcriptase